MAPNGWATPKQTLLLTSLLPEYEKCQINRRYKPFWMLLYAVEVLFPGLQIQDLDESQMTQYRLALDKLQSVEVQRSKPKGSRYCTRQGPQSDLLPTHPSPKAYEAFSKLYPVKVRAAVDRLCEEQGISGRNKLKYWHVVCKDLYTNATEEELKEVDDYVELNNEEEEEEEVLSPKEHQRPSVVDPPVRKAGLMALITLVGPVPDANGKISAWTLQFGDKDDTPLFSSSWHLNRSQCNLRMHEASPRPASTSETSQPSVSAGLSTPNASEHSNLPEMGSSAGKKHDPEEHHHQLPSPAIQARSRVVIYPRSVFPQALGHFPKRCLTPPNHSLDSDGLSPRDFEFDLNDHLYPRRQLRLRQSADFRYRVRSAPTFVGHLPPQRLSSTLDDLLGDSLSSEGLPKRPSFGQVSSEGWKSSNGHLLSNTWGSKASPAGYVERQFNPTFPLLLPLNSRASSPKIASPIRDDHFLFDTPPASSPPLTELTPPQQEPLDLVLPSRMREACSPATPPTSSPSPAKPSPAKHQTADPNLGFHVQDKPSSSTLPASNPAITEASPTQQRTINTILASPNGGTPSSPTPPASSPPPAQLDQPVDSNPASPASSIQPSIKQTSQSQPRETLKATSEAHPPTPTRALPETSRASRCASLPEGPPYPLKPGEASANCAPGWYTAALADLKDTNLGAAWVALVEKWDTLEQALGYGTVARGSMPVKERPKSGLNGRRKAPTELATILDHPSSTILLTLAWRSHNGGSPFSPLSVLLTALSPPPSTIPTPSVATFGDLFANQVQTVLVALMMLMLWWGRAAAPGPDLYREDSRDAWKALVDDVTMSFTAIIETNPSRGHKRIADENTVSDPSVQLAKRFVLVVNRIQTATFGTRDPHIRQSPVERVIQWYWWSFLHVFLCGAVRGARGLVHGVGAWCLVLGAWCLVLGAWCLVPGAWCMVLGACCVISQHLSSLARLTISEMGTFAQCDLAPTGAKKKGIK
ncbi:hypothetical protein DFP72DRAFT_859714 [Ephemerocybe angulata]|uniref:Uncharacterized protein n=1 Tax=Ephemerocybe angulata TaxID=980116 RepID=A0A8H6LW60_9AGAR|nr:hypothetical protein DFP72DRAFT_859714 [Tulosesus angulatus]